MTRVRSNVSNVTQFMEVTSGKAWKKYVTFCIKLRVGSFQIFSRGTKFCNICIVWCPLTLVQINKDGREGLFCHRNSAQVLSSVGTWNVITGSEELQLWSLVGTGICGEKISLLRGETWHYITMDWRNRGCLSSALLWPTNLFSWWKVYLPYYQESSMTIK